MSPADMLSNIGVSGSIAGDDTLRHAGSRSESNSGNPCSACKQVRSSGPSIGKISSPTSPIFSVKNDNTASEAPAVYSNRITRDARRLSSKSSIPIIRSAASSSRHSTSALRLIRNATTSATVRLGNNSPMWWATTSSNIAYSTPSEPLRSVITRGSTRPSGTTAKSHGWFSSRSYASMPSPATSRTQR